MVWKILLFIFIGVSCAEWTQKKSIRLVSKEENTGFFAPKEEPFPGSEQLSGDDDEPLPGYDGFDLITLQEKINALICDSLINQIDQCFDNDFDENITVMVNLDLLNFFEVQQIEDESGRFGGTIIGGKNLVLYAILLLDLIVRQGFIDARKAEIVLFESYIPIQEEKEDRHLFYDDKLFFALKMAIDSVSNL